MSTIDSSVLLGYYQARTGQTSSLATGSSGTTKVKYAPTAPWATNSGAPRASALVETVMMGRRFIDENAATLDLAGASDDYKKLFSLFQGLNALTGLAERMSVRGVTETEKGKIQKVFAKGLAESTAYADSLKLEQLRLTRGEAMLSDKTKVGVPRANYTYTTATVHEGTASEAVAQFAGATSINIAVKKLSGTQNIAIDLSEMTGTRSMSTVASFINSKLTEAGVATRFQVSRTAGEPKIVKTGNTTVTLPATSDKFAFKVVGDSAETVTFSAAGATPAVYVSTTAGNPDPDKDSKTADAVYATSLIKTSAATTPGGVGARVFANGLEKTVTGVKDSQVGADGSVYMLAEVSGAVDGQAIKGAKDVALLKYDSQGQLMFARTLGAVGTTTANALTVSADGKVAIAGSITGQMEGTVNGPINSGPTSTLSDSFVTLYDAKGDEVWTQRRGALQADEATAVAFGDDGVVYVGGRTKSGMPGGTGALGGWDGYLSGISTDARGAPKTLFTQQFGTGVDDTVEGLVVNGGRVIVAGMDNKNARLRSFDVTGGVAVAGASRDLGDLQGGSLAGIKLEGGELYIGGSTRNAALALGAPASAHAGGMDGFAARLSTDLSSTASDALSYYGGTKDDTVTGMAVAGGKVWLTGVAGDNLPGAGAPIASKDGYIVALDPATGEASSQQRITGKDGYVTPTSIAVDATGASALDAFGLPKGALVYTDSQKIVSATSARAGDSFQIRTRAGGALATITLSADDTLETLAGKIKRAGGYRAKVEVISDGGYRRIKITPANDEATVEVLPGKGGKDMLEALGLTEGVVRNTVMKDGKSVAADGKGNIYGLALANDINLKDEDSVRNALLVLSKATGAIRAAYKDLENAAKPQSVSNPTASGPVPAYLSNQISNYQAALNRLTGGY
ncbi:MAG: hypothetical protein EON95_13300 [Caulobacteraceae bacterium]|nr:MAG: hypothetical protein EON95_13300 [Caulobacteraceae bacterium]